METNTTADDATPWESRCEAFYNGCDEIASTLDPISRVEFTREMGRILEACFQIKSREETNIWSGRLGLGVYLGIKLSDAERDDVKSRDYLQNAMDRLLSEMETCEEKKHPCMSLLSNPSVGARCLLVSLLVRLEQHEEARRIAHGVVLELAALYEQTRTKNDCSILFGLAGGLQAIWHLRHNLDDNTIGSDLATKIGYSMLLQGLKQNDKLGNTMFLVWEWNGWPYLGAATGVVGILFALLGLTPHEWERIEESLPNARDVVRDSIDGLAMHHLYPSGNLKDSITGFEEEDRFVGWTHGASGYCLLLLQAFEVYGHEKYVYWTIEIANRVLWPRCRNDSKGEIGLARGITGIAYVFVALARVDVRQNQTWIHRARKLAALAVCDILQANTHESNDSLFDGIGGLASLLIDLEDESSSSEKRPSCFPLLESYRAGNTPRTFDYKTKPEDYPLNIHDPPNDTTKDNNYPESSCTPIGKRKMFLSSTESNSPPVSTAGTAPTASVTTNHSSILQRSSTHGAIRKTNPLDISQLTEAFPMPEEVGVKSPSRCNNDHITPIPPDEKNDITIKNTTTMNCSDISPQSTGVSVEFPLTTNSEKITHFRDLVRRRHYGELTTSAPLSRNVTESWKAKTRGMAMDRDHAMKDGRDLGFDSEGYDEGFLTDSIDRKQRAEASWMKHFGSQAQQLQYRKRNQQLYSENAGRKTSSRNFRYMIGAFSSLQDTDSTTTFPNS